MTFLLFGAVFVAFVFGYTIRGLVEMNTEAEKEKMKTLNDKYESGYYAGFEKFAEQSK